jgi:hypothetical protein
VDWVTLQDHRGQHAGDYAALVGPSFTGSRIRQRAHDHGVVLLDVETLSGLLRQHALVPLGLEVYRKLFEYTEGADGSTAVAEAAEEADRRTRLAAEIIRVISANEGNEGPLRARDLYWLLRDSREELSGYTEEEIGEILTALAAPGLELLAPAAGGYLTLGSRQTMRARLQHLAELIAEEEAAGGAGLPPE